MYLKLFKELGFKVTFIAENFNKLEPFTTVLQKNGIKVLCGKLYKKGIESWLKKHLIQYKYVYLERPKSGNKFIDLIRNNFSGKIFYFGHDLHFIRLLREYNITHNKNILEQSNNIKKIEMEIFSKVNIIHVVGSYEQNLLQKKFPEKPIRNIPIFVYDTQFPNVEKDFSKRKDLIFVGGFSHSPNIDAIKWFNSEIFPRIIYKFPNIILHIVGSNVPQIIKKMQSNNIKIEGPLQEKELYLLYNQCRIAIAPLRFGAGIKGKVVEAAYFQIPMVTTSIGGEGLDYSIGSFLIADDSQKMAKLICQLYLEFSKLRQMSDSGKIFIEKYFSKNKAKEALLKDIDI